EPLLLAVDRAQVVVSVHKPRIESHRFFIGFERLLRAAQQAIGVSQVVIGRSVAWPDSDRFPANVQSFLKPPHASIRGAEVDQRHIVVWNDPNGALEQRYTVAPVT